MIRKFHGFSAHAGRSTPLPGAFFSELLPLIDDLAELKVTLFCFWALYQREGDFRYLSLPDFLGDAALMDGLRAAAPAQSPEATLEAALARACERASLLAASVAIDDQPITIYFVNTERGRAAVAQIEAGQWRPGPALQRPVEILPERPNIYRLYEANIGPLTPMIAESLKAAEREYPADWLEDVVRVAVENNARSWRYMQKVLERWAQEGKSRETAGSRSAKDWQRYIRGQFADFIRNRPDD